MVGDECRPGFARGRFHSPHRFGLHLHRAGRSEYVRNGKPVLLYEPFEEITKRHPDVGRWQKVTVEAIGFAPHETMRRHPAVHIKETYAKARELMRLHTGKPAEEYIRSKRDEFPHEFCEFVTL